MQEDIEKKKLTKVKMFKSVVWEGKIIPASTLPDPKTETKGKDVIVTFPTWYASALISEKRAEEVKSNKPETVNINQKEEAIRIATEKVTAAANSAAEIIKVATKAKAEAVSVANAGLMAAHVGLANAKPEEKKAAEIKLKDAQKVLSGAIAALSK